MLSRTCLPLWPKTEYVPPLRVTFTKYDKNPWSSTPECDGPVRHPPRRMPTLILKYRPYSRATRSAAAFDAPSNECNVDRKSTRLNSSHGYISYAVFCLKKKKHKSTACHMT